MNVKTTFDIMLLQSSALVVASLVLCGCDPQDKASKPKPSPTAKDAGLADVDSEDEDAGVSSAGDVASTGGDDAKTNLDAGQQSLDVGTATDASSTDPDVGVDTNEAVGKVWNVLVYMAADNNLEANGIDDIKEMMAVTASKNIVFHIQTDRAEEFYELGLGNLKNWTNTLRLQLANGKLTQTADIGEVNMGKQESLQDFITWGLGATKADRHMLILWNHGEGWRGFGVDDFDKDHLTLAEMVTATEKGLAEAKLERFDIFGFDACLMGDLQVLHALRGTTDFFVASQDLEPAHGWNYASFEAVVDDPDIEPAELASTIVTGFRKQALKNDTWMSVTLAAIRADKIDAVMKAFVTFSKAAEGKMVGPSGKPDANRQMLQRLGNVRSKMQRFGRSADPAHDYQMVDLADLTKRIAVQDDTLAAVAKDVSDAIAAAVVKRIKGPLTKASTGFSIYFPSLQEEYLEEFDQVALSGPWREVLKTFYGGGKEAASKTPKFHAKSCAGCVVGTPEVKTECVDGLVQATHALTPESVKHVVKAELYVGYEREDGSFEAYTKTPAVVSDTGKVESKWSQHLLVVRQGANVAPLYADTTIEGVYAIHEIPVRIAGPAKCPCVLPGDGGFWDSDHDGVANCVDLDDDNDGVVDSVDVCQYVPDPKQLDSNSDGTGDACTKNAHAPKLKCKVDVVAPYGPERTALLQVVTHLIQKKTVTYAFYVRNPGGIAEEAPKGHHRLRPMVFRAAANGGGFKWAAADPVPKRLDHPLQFEYVPIHVGLAKTATGVTAQDADGETVSLKDQMAMKKLFMHLVVTGVGGHAADAFWAGDPQEDIGVCPPAEVTHTFCAAPNIVDCDGKCWAPELLGDAKCHAGQDSGPNFYCESLEFDKGACKSPPCPAGSGLVRDCNGKCLAKPAMKGDGVCHQGLPVGTADLVCAAFDNDGKDCMCAKNCHGHGSCVGKACECDKGWSGDYCQKHESCGDGKCEGTEQCGTCPADCGSCAKACGDGTCEKWLGEDCGTCPGDCGACKCGDGVCSTKTEDCSSCGKDCGACPVCGDEVCAVWAPSAHFPKAKAERCDTCPNDCGSCQGECCVPHTAKQNHSFLGGGCSDAKVTKCVCDKNEACCVTGWSAACVALANTVCGAACCKPNCEGKACGPDGCGGPCGTCDDKNECTLDQCDAKTGACSAVPTKGPCDDADPCAVNSACSKGKCGSGQPNCDDLPCIQQKCDKGVCAVIGKLNCDDKNECTADSCDLNTGKCVNATVKDGAKCDADGSACTANDVCAQGKCNAGTLTKCDDASVCTVDSCDPKTGACVNTAVKDGAKCDADGSVCTSNDGCAKGKCVAGGKLDCADGNACSDDSCDKAKGCVNAPNTATCTDDSKCTNNDACAGGACLAKIISCDDSNACSDDSCDKAKGCVNAPNTATCTDNDKCTTGERCSGQQCAGAKKTNCDDSNACTADSCDKAKGCVHTTNTDKCDDGDKCTVNEQCLGGTCGGHTTTSHCAGANDGKTLQLGCDVGKISAIKFAHYGTLAATCPAPKAGTCDKDAVALIKDACLGKTLCSTSEWHKKLGDPCFNQAQSIAVTFECKDEGTKKQLNCDDGNACTEDACDKLAGCKIAAIVAFDPSLVSSASVPLTAGDAHTCGVQADGTVKCWGGNFEGQLGDATTTSKQVPTQVLAVNNTPPPATQVLTGVVGVSAKHHTCAVTSAGHASCWGPNKYGVLGSGDTKTATSAVEVITAAKVKLAGVARVAPGAAFSCALMKAGTVFCWGNNDSGQLGGSSAGVNLAPTALPNLSGIKAIASGESHACVVHSDGTVSCWGANKEGQLGDGSIVGKTKPTLIQGTKVTTLTAGRAHTCAVRVDKKVECWGDNAKGQLGVGTYVDEKAPKTINNLTDVVAIAAGDMHTCAVWGAVGNVSCWGLNADGQLGDGAATNRNTPNQIQSLSGIVAIAAGGGHTCGLKKDGTAWCWGRNAAGQLGDSTTVAKSVPTRVIAPGCDDGNACSANDICLGTVCKGTKQCDIAVNSASDTSDGTCNSAHCSLREAITTANANSDTTVIGVQVGGQITLVKSLPVVKEATEVIGNGKQSPIIHGSDKYLGFVTKKKFTLRNITMQQCAGGTGSGSAVRDEGGNVSLYDVQFTKNSASNGGAVSLLGTAVIDGCSFTANNSVPGQEGYLGGGGVQLSGVKNVVRNSTFNANTAVKGAGGGLLCSDCTATLLASTFHANTAEHGGGIAGICLGNQCAPLTVVNSTIRDNVATADGGGLNADNLVVHHCSISNNSAKTGANIIWLQSGTVANTLLANPLGGGKNCSFDGSQPLGTGSLSSDGSCGTLTKLVMSSLAHNGGPTQTMALLSGSPAIDKADTQTCTAGPTAGVDQRGVKRPQGGGCDVGAFELFSQ